MEFRYRGAGARVLLVVRVADVASTIGGEEVRGSFIAGELGDSILAGGKLEDVAVVGRIVEVPVEPPLLKGIVDQRGHWTIVVGEGLCGHIESPHGWMPKCCRGIWLVPSA